MLRVASRCSFRLVHRYCVPRAAVVADYHSTAQRSRRRSLPTIPLPQYDYTAEEELTGEDLKVQETVEENVSDDGPTDIVSIDAATAEHEEVEVESSHGDDMKTSHTPTWFQLGVCEDMRIVMKKAGLRNYSNVAQAECLPAMMEGCNMLIHALPGSGLTTAYCVMICNRAVQSLHNTHTGRPTGRPSTESKKRIANSEDVVNAPAVLTSKTVLTKLRALQGAAVIGVHSLILVRNSAQVRLVAELFNKYFGNTFRACPMYEASDMVVDADTAVLVTTPAVALGMDLATLAHRIDTVVLDGTLQAYILNKLFALPPPTTRAATLLGGDGDEDLPARQIIGIAHDPSTFGRAAPAFRKRDSATVQLEASFRPQAFRRPAHAVEHVFVPVADERAALKSLVLRLLRAVPDRVRYEDVTQEQCQRVLIIANRQVTEDGIANAWSAIQDPTQFKPLHKRPWFAKPKFHAMTASRHQWRAHDLFRSGAVPLLLTTQDFVSGVPTFGNVDLVIMYGMPEPLDYFMACRHVEARNGKVATIHDNSRAKLADVLLSLVAESPAAAEELHNDVTARLISMPFSMSSVCKWRALVLAASTPAMNRMSRDCGDIDALAEKVSQHLYTKTVPRSGRRESRRF